MNGSIMLFMPKLYYGGAETQFRYFIEHCNKKRQKLYVIVENKDDIAEFSKKNENVFFYQLNLSFLEYIEYSGIKISLLKIRDYIKGLYKIIVFIFKHRDIKYSIIYDGFGLRLAWLLKLFKIKVLFSERSSGELICKKWMNRIGIRFSDILCANSVSGQKYIANLAGRNVNLVYNGVKLRNVNVKEKESPYIILVSARISKIKNIKGVIEALKVLKDNWNSEFKAYFCGIVADQNYYEELQELVKTYFLDGNIEFKGYVKNMPMYYEKADLVVLASFSEGMPNAILEAYANKRLAVASNIEMNAAVVREEKFLFDPNDYNSIANKINMALNMSDTEKNAYIYANYDFIKKEFSVEKMAENYLAFFQ